MLPVIIYFCEGEKKKYQQDLWDQALLYFWSLLHKTDESHSHRMWFNFEGGNKTAVFLRGLVMGILEMLRSASNQVTWPSLGACRMDVFVMVTSRHLAWRVEFPTSIASSLGEDIIAFPTVYSLPSRYGQLHCAHCSPLFYFFFLVDASGSISLSFCSANKGIICCAEIPDKGPVLKPFLCKIPTPPLEISPKQQW